MKRFLDGLREIYGLFVEDGRYTVALLAWVFFAAFASQHVAQKSWAAPMFFLGFAVVLVGSVWRTAAKRAFQKD